MCRECRRLPRAVVQSIVWREGVQGSELIQYPFPVVLPERRLRIDGGALHEVIGNGGALLRLRDRILNLTSFHHLRRNP